MKIDDSQLWSGLIGLALDLDHQPASIMLAMFLKIFFCALDPLIERRREPS